MNESVSDSGLGVVLAAVDDSAAARPVLLTAARLARLTGALVEAVHVREDGPGATAAATAEAAHVPLRECRGDPIARIAEEAALPEVRAVVVGARRAPTSPGVGHVALELICRVTKPVVVAPPVVSEGPIARILVPHDGRETTTEALRELLRPVAGPGGPEIVVLHVFEPDDLPLFADQQAYETEAWSREFLDRCSPVVGAGEVRLEVRVGPAEETVRAASDELAADIVAVGWKRDLSAGRARVVRSLLERCDRPVVLLPVARAEASV